MKPYAASVSLANLLFLKSWTELYQLRGQFPSAPRSPSFIALLEATIFNVALAAAVFCLLVFLVRRSGKKWLSVTGQCAFLVLCTLPLDRLCWSVYAQVYHTLPVPLLQGIWGLLLATPLLGCVMLAVYSNPIVLRGVVAILTIAAPAAVLIPGNLTWAVFRASPQPALQFASATTQHSPRRVLWVIFDELDRRVAVERRPTGLKLPELDRLRARSFTARRASTPAPDTAESVRALITGEPSSSRGDVRNVRTIFSEVRERGWNSALVGWHFPYCQDLSRELVQCIEPGIDVDIPRDPLRIVGKQWSDEMNESWIATRFTRSGQNRVPWLGWGTRQVYLAAFLYMRDPALQIVADPRFSFVFLHLSIPHPVGIYNRHSREIVNDPQSNYLDNLALVDRTLGEIRAALAKSGLEDSTDLIVTSDHPLRVQMWMDSGVWDEEEGAATGNVRGDFVPFIVYLASDKSRTIYTRPFNTLVTKDLVMAMLEGNIAGQGDVSKFLDAAPPVTTVTTSNPSSAATQ
jgi:Sulfatase